MGVQCGAAVAWENMSADVALGLRSRPSAGTTERRVARSSALTSHVRPPGTMAVPGSSGSGCL